MIEGYNGIYDNQERNNSKTEKIACNNYFYPVLL